MTFRSLPFPGAPRVLAALVALAALAGCSTVEKVVSGDKIDYRSATPARKTGLEVPPDLTQISREQRAPAGSSVSASSYQAPSLQPSAAQTTAVDRAVAAGLRIERSGNERWLVTPLTPAQLWPQLRDFWTENGFVLIVDQMDAGLMETDWAENRAKLPQDFIRQTLGRLIDSVYSTGERDKFRVRVERTPTGTEVYISHRGLEEVYVGALRESTTWKPRATDPNLEGVFLQRLMVKLGAKEDVARTAVATAPQPAPRAHVLAGQSTATLQLDDSFDRAWRRVGLALDRSGFTVEDRDRSQGVFHVRYVDPAAAGREEPGVFGKLFGRGRSTPRSAPVRYRVTVKPSGEAASLVQVQNSQGAPETGEAGQRIVRLLLEDLK